MSNVLSLKHLKNNVSRNGFDMSEKRAFTAKVGEILPCFVLETIPGDSVNINPSHFTRTMPVNTAAFTQLKEYIHYYYVPYSQLYKDVREFFSDSGDESKKATSITSKKSIGSSLPYLTFRSIAKYIYRMANSKVTTSTGFSQAYATCKLLEYLGYGDFWKFMKFNINSHGVTGSDEVLNNINPTYVYPENNESITYNDFHSFRNFNSNIRLNPFALLAYQKIYQDHFRNKSWEKYNSPACNIDYMEFGAEIPIDNLKYDGTSKVANDMFTLRYCDYAKDYFLGLLPRAQYGESVVVPLSGNVYGDMIDTEDNLGEYKFRDLAQALTSEDRFGAAILALRRAEALQKYREIKATGITDYQAFLDKIFNVDISNFDSGESIYLGGYNSDVNISEVVNTSLNDDAIADIKGKGTASGGSNTIKFEAKDYGVIIGLYTCRPVLDYSISAPLKTNQRISLDDYANPVFDKVGMEAVHLNDIVMPYDYYYKTISSGSQYGGENAKNNSKAFTPIGYAPRYYSYKTNFDKVLGEFRNTLSSWVSPLKSDDFIDKVEPSLYPHNANVGNFNDLKVMSYQDFKVNPSVLNSIFVQHVDDSLSTDQLLVNFNNNCPIVRNLDYDGLPY